MSITIKVDYRDADGHWQPIELDDEGHLAGHEVARVQLWGAPIMHQLGLTLLPQLANGQPLIVENAAQLDQLATEARIVLDNIVLITDNTTYPKDRHILIQRAENILYAAMNAQAYNGRVWIG
jgi:hypothetical protein